MSKIEPMEPTTRLTGLAFSENSPSVYRALYLPQLTQQQVIDLPVSDELVGAVVFNTDTEELETYTAAGFWLPILTAQSNLDLDHLTVETIVINESITAAQGVEANLYSIHSHDIINDTGIQSDSIINNSLITTLGIHVQSNAQIDGNMLCNSGGVVNDLGVNGNLTGGNIASLGTLQANGDTELNGDLVVTGDIVTIDGNLNVTGTSILAHVSSPIIDVNDFEASTNRVDGLLYGLANVGGSAPIVATLDVGAGTGATYTMTGSNLSGRFTLTTGSSPVVGVIATFTLPSYLIPLMTGQGCMIMTPSSATTAVYETTSKTYTTGAPGNTISLIGSSLTPLSASTTYTWNYMIIGNILGT